MTIVRVFDFFPLLSIYLGLAQDLMLFDTVRFHCKIVVLFNRLQRIRTQIFGEVFLSSVFAVHIAQLLNTRLHPKVACVGSVVGVLDFLDAA